MATVGYLPLPPSVIRSVGIHHWQAGLDRFDGRKPLQVYIQVDNSKSIWTHTIEILNSKTMCITRLNGAIKDMFEAKEI
jgi:hypothetical protein